MPVIPWNASKGNLSHFKLDVTRYEECLKLINQENPKIIYHLVAQPLVTAAMRHPFSTLELTVRGAYNLLEAIRQSGSKARVVVFTSDKVYGENDHATEEDRIDTVTHPYDVAKSCEDLISRSYAKSFGLDIISVRSANVYGGGDLHWDRLIPHLCKELIHDRHPVFRSTGNMVRDYIYVEDVLDGILLAADTLQSGDTLNLGSSVSYTAHEVADALLYVSGKNLPPVVVETATKEIQKQHILYDKARNLGWSPKTGLTSGLVKTYNWYREWFST